MASIQWAAQTIKKIDAMCGRSEYDVPVNGNLADRIRLPIEQSRSDFDLFMIFVDNGL